MQPRIVKEIKVRIIPSDLAHSFNLALRIKSHGKSRLVQNIINGNCQPIFMRLQMTIQLHLERCKAACMLHRQRSIDIYLRFMGCRAETKNDSLRDKCPRNNKFAFIPNPTNMVANIGGNPDIIIGGWNSHRNRIA
ncbi:hypothetical protein D3C78_1154730 [compost metagenome]